MAINKVDRGIIQGRINVRSSGPNPQAPSPSAEVIHLAPNGRDIEPLLWERRRRRIRICLGFLPPLVGIALWQWASTSGALDARFFPAPTSVWDEALGLIRSGVLFGHVVYSTKLVVVGFVLGASTGVLIGLALGRMAYLRAAFSPALAAAFTVPKLAIFPLILLIFGIGDRSKVVLVAVTTFLLVVHATMDASNSVPQAYLDVGRTFHAKRRNQFFEIVLPHCLPSIFTALRLAGAIALLVEISSEFVAANEGVGYLIWNSWTLLLPAKMFVGIVTVAMMGAATIAIIRRCEKWVIRWERPRKG